MNKIIALSTNGFQLDEWYDENDLGYTKKWFTCDKKKVILSGMFSNLRKGLELTDIKFNKDGKYVIDFTIPSSLNVVGGKQVLERDGGNTNPLNIPLKNISSNSNPSSVQDSIKKDGLMYGQSINLGFQYVLKNFECTDEMFWSEVFNQADKCYNEMLKRC